MKEKIKDLAKLYTELLLITNKQGYNHSIDNDLLNAFRKSIELSILELGKSITFNTDDDYSNARAEYSYFDYNVLYFEFEDFSKDAGNRNSTIIFKSKEALNNWIEKRSIFYSFADLVEVGIDKHYFELAEKE